MEKIMKFEPPINPNYCATVVKIKTLIPLAGCDNVVGTPIFGFQAIVSKDHQAGDLGVVFPAETQLSEEFCFENNLHRHDDKNKTLGVKGYLEDSRRIKSIKFRGHRSDCLFMSLDSLKYLGVDSGDFKEGDEFDFISGKEVCRKYVVAHRAWSGQQKAEDKQWKRVDSKFMPEHLDSENYFKFLDTIDPEAEVIVSQKLHGTSVRVGHTIVSRKLNIVDKLLKKVGVKVQETEFDYVFGSRKVIKDINNPNQNHYYEMDIWTTEGKKLEGILPHNFLVYAELIGWTPTNAPIQKDYTYGVPQGTCDMYIYRVAFVNDQGIVTDLAWNQVKQFCGERGLKTVVELYRGKLKDFDITKYLDKRFQDTDYRYAVPLGDNKLVDEGVCVRIDGYAPRILKAKSPLFLQHETEILDTGVEDLESQQTV